jgi:hypothetical protein
VSTNAIPDRFTRLSDEHALQATVLIRQQASF